MNSEAHPNPTGHPAHSPVWQSWLGLLFAAVGRVLSRTSGRRQDRPATLRVLEYYRTLLEDLGAVVWEFDTHRPFETTNGIAANGGSINGPAPTVAGGMVYVSSGYGAYGGWFGNVLLAFGVD